jgi:hypothetical protein
MVQVGGTGVRFMGGQESTVRAEKHRREQHTDMPRPGGMGAGTWRRDKGGVLAGLDFALW